MARMMRLHMLKYKYLFNTAILTYDTHTYIYTYLGLFRISRVYENIMYALVLRTLFGAPLFQVALAGSMSNLRVVAEKRYLLVGFDESSCEEFDTSSDVHMFQQGWYHQA